ncbi:MAG: carotenoid biosynthesis protein [Bacteroidota bacterium]
MMNNTTTFSLAQWPATTLASAFLIIWYMVGTVGILIPVHEQFVLLTPLNLLLSLAIVFYFHNDWNARTVGVLACCFVGGYAAELFGVHTGLLFGNYAYGPVLGWKWQETPLMIGVNWMMLVYCIGTTINRFLERSGWLVKVLMGAALMVSLDILIEPVAMYYDFWSWEGNVVPIKNYIGWFGVSLPLFGLFFWQLPKARNKVAFVLLLIQFLFFWILGLSW